MTNTPDNFVAGKTKYFYDSWAALTSDPVILSWSQGIHLDFETHISQYHVPSPINFAPAEHRAMSLEILNMSRKGIIEPAVHSQGEFISNIFCREKKDGSCRIILNLKKLNEAIEYHKFKMDTLKSAISLMRKGCFMGSVDLKDAYYSFPIHVDDRKYLRFLWDGQLWQFTCLPNGLAEAPRKFTKLMKVPFSQLRKEGHVNSAYLDDSFLQGEGFDECAINICQTVQLLDGLGLTVHPEKSVLFPTQILVFLGFVLNSILMIVSLTMQKAQKVVSLCQHRLQNRRCTIREFAELIGTLVSTEPGIEYAPLFYRGLEREKAEALKVNYGNFEAKITLSNEACKDLEWWIENTPIAHKEILHPEPSVTIQSDSSGSAWGGIYKDKRTGGPWSAEEKEMHINEKELLAAFFTLKCFCGDMTDCHIRLEIDNTTAVAYVNNQGGRRKHLHDMVKEMWLWAKERHLWISAIHLAGSLNVEADKESRKMYGSEAEWQIKPSIFSDIMVELGPCDIDLFASRLNAQLPNYVAWHPDPGAIAIDAFAMTWTNRSLFAFPPFCVISRILAKVAAEEADMVIVVPLWPTQHWFASLLRMTVDTPRILPKHNLRLPTDPNKEHPLQKTLHLTAFKISGSRCKQQAFQTTLPLSSSLHGERPPRSNTGLISVDGCYFVVNSKLIHCSHLCQSS